MDSEERKKLFERYDVEQNRRNAKKIFAIAGILIAAAFIFFIYSGTPILPEKTGAVFSDAVRSGTYKITTNLPADRCYWVRSTTNQKGFVLQIREYNSSSRNCMGDLLNITEIPLTSPLNLIGNDCICGKKTCEMENVFEYNRTDLKIRC